MLQQALDRGYAVVQGNKDRGLRGLLVQDEVAQGPADGDYLMGGEAVKAPSASASPPRRRR